MRNATRGVLLSIAALLLAPAAGRAADAPCMVIHLTPGRTATLAAADVDAITKAMRDAMQPAVPRAKVMLNQDMAAALQSDALSGTDPQSDPLVYAFNHNSVPARWSLLQAGHTTELVLVIQQGSGFELFSGMQDVPNASRAVLTGAARTLGAQGGARVAGKFYCLALSEHSVTIDFNQPAQRRHPFQAHVTDLAGTPVSGQDVDFNVASAGSSVSPASGSTEGGSARTLYEMHQPENTTLTASMKPPYQDTVEDQAAIAVTGDYGIHIRGTHHLDLAKICADKIGTLGFIVQLAQALSPAAAVTQPGEQFTCSGEGVEDDDLVIPVLTKTDAGYGGTASWTAKIDTPSAQLRSSQMTVVAKLARPYTLTDSATATGTITGDERHLEVTVDGWARSVPTRGGGGTGTVTFAPGSFWGAVQEAARAAAAAGIPTTPEQQAALQNPATVAIPPDQPASAIFKLTFPITLPDPSRHVTQMAPFEVSGTDDLGTFRYTIWVEMAPSAAPPR